jgi:hypothetical protein
LFGGILGIVVALLLYALLLPLEQQGKIMLALAAWLLNLLIFTPIESGHTSLYF